MERGTVTGGPNAVLSWSFGYSAAVLGSGGEARDEGKGEGQRAAPTGALD